MKAETREWAAKADGDFFDAQRGIRARSNPNFDGVCFHCQQCIEKYLKARMIEAGMSFPKIHDLARLLDLVSKAESSWESWRSDLEVLTDYAVSFRYPEESATREEALRSFKTCRTLRVAIREALGVRDNKPRAVKKKRKDG